MVPRGLVARPVAGHDAGSTQLGGAVAMRHGLGGLRDHAFVFPVRTRWKRAVVCLVFRANPIAVKARVRCVSFQDRILHNCPTGIALRTPSASDSLAAGAMVRRRWDIVRTKERTTIECCHVGIQGASLCATARVLMGSDLSRGNLHCRQ